MDAEGIISSWQQAFDDHRIPETRALEKQLRTSATRDREKLRSLVGGSYRELLATAEAIVVLETDAKNVEENISNLGQKCRPQVQPASAPSPSPRKTTLAQLRLLQRCMATAANLLREKNVLQSSQLMVVCRLLLKSLGATESIAKTAESLRSKISLLRRQLLRYVDSQLVSPLSRKSELLDALCSYCLMTSVSSDDALSHLRQLRLDKLRRQLRSDNLNQDRICRAFEYQISSLQTFKQLFGRSISEALNGLQKRPILQDPAIQQLESLDLDRTLSLVPDEIRSFLPYFKKSAPTAGEIHALLQAWSHDASTVLGEALAKQLKLLDNIGGLVHFRKELYMILLPSYFSTPANSTVLASIRKTLNERIESLCKGKAAQLDEVSTLLTRDVSKQPKSLWDLELVQSDLSNGASKHIQQIKNRHSGIAGPLVKAAKTLDKWTASIQAMENSIRELSSIRWRDSIEEPDDEQEEEAAAMVQTLSKEDPDLYKSVLHSSILKSLKSFENVIVDNSKQATKDELDLARVLTLLRGIRMASIALRPAFPQQNMFADVDAAVPKLHQEIATEVARRLSQAGENASKAKSLPAGSLPESMPSPRAFSTLRNLCNIMLAIGATDIWSATAVDLVKEAVRKCVFESGNKQWYVNSEFDELYLRIALGAEASGAGNTSGAKEYWNRTKLLFGLLNT